jgi:hypothetical protein
MVIVSALFVLSAGGSSPSSGLKGRREYIRIGLSPASLPDTPLWPDDGLRANSRTALPSEW